MTAIHRGNESTSPTDTIEQPPRFFADLLSRFLSSWTGRISLIILLVIFGITLVGPWLAPYDPDAMSASILQPPSGEHWMGTDNFGRDVFSRFLYATRTSVFVGLFAVAVASIVGSTAGMIAGYASGRIWDGLIMRSMDIVLAFPLLVLVPVVTGIFGASGITIGPIKLSTVPLMTLAISLVFIPIFARVARSSVLAEMEEEYVIAARTFGARWRYLLVHNLLPNIAAPLVVQAAFAFGGAVVVEAAVSFLGLGVQAPGASWGTLLADGRNYLTLGCWWLVVFPALALAMTVLSFNLLGDELRDQLDPRARASINKFSREKLANLKEDKTNV